MLVEQRHGFELGLRHVHASTVANTSLSLGRRASGVAYLGR